MSVSQKVREGGNRASVLCRFPLLELYWLTLCFFFNSVRVKISLFWRVWEDGWNDESWQVIRRDILSFSSDCTAEVVCQLLVCLNAFGLLMVPQAVLVKCYKRRVKPVTCSASFKSRIFISWVLTEKGNKNGFKCTLFSSVIMESSVRSHCWALALMALLT